jgi:hypothetical protein
MADVGEELVFGPLRLQQRLGIGFALCDISAVEDQSVDIILVSQVDRIVLQVFVRFVLAEKLELNLGLVSALAAPPENSLESFYGLGRKEVEE